MFEPSNWCMHNVNPLESKGNYSATSNNIKLVHWPLMGGLLHLLQQGGAAATPSPLLTVPNVTAYPSTASVPITVLPYDGLLLCGFNVASKGEYKLIKTNLNIPSTHAPFSRNTSSDRVVCIHGNLRSGKRSACIIIISSSVLPNIDGWNINFCTTPFYKVTICTILLHSKVSANLVYAQTRYVTYDKHAIDQLTYQLSPYRRP